MTRLKSYTDISQSKKLAEFLPLESADMIWDLANPDLPTVRAIYYKDSDYSNKYLNIMPAWSLGALINIFKTQIKNSTNISIEFLTTSEGTSLVCCSFLLLDEEIISDSRSIAEEANTDIDACIKIILKLHEQKLI